VAHLQAELAQSQGRAGALESEVGMLRKQLQRAREQAADSERLSGANAELQEQLAALQKATSLVGPPARAACAPACCALCTRGLLPGSPRCGGALGEPR
jgi:hypothetical protein